MLGLISGSNSQVRFGRSAKLGSVVHKKTQAEDEIALWAYSETFPGYLRGAVFTQFEASEWKAPMEYGSLDANLASESPQGLGAKSEGEFLFLHGSLTPEENSRWQTMECWLKQDQESAAFTPQGTTHLIVQGDRLGILPFGVFVLKDLESSNPYIACVPDRIAPDSMDFLPDDRWLQIPEDYQSELNNLARRIFANAATAEEKIQAVEDYFQENFQYHMGIEIPNGEDPLLYFLKEKPAAHCEYFASAATLLLRTSGVPARYVTGLVPGEWNSSGQYWTARNRDAHAWVEAYVDSKGWVTVEATPSEGVPSAEMRPAKNAFWETLKNDWQRLRTYLSQSRWNRLWQLLISSWLGGFVFVFLLAFAGYLAIRIPWPWRFRSKVGESLDPRLAPMRDLLARMDHLLIRYGLQRHPGETLHQFARRIGDSKEWQSQATHSGESSRELLADKAQQAAKWYRDYARLRYQGHWREADLEDLRSRLPAG
jgi:hypothetical protein